MQTNLAGNTAGIFLRFEVYEFNKRGCTNDLCGAKSSEYTSLKWSPGGELHGITTGGWLDQRFRLANSTHCIAVAANSHSMLRVISNAPYTR